MCFSGVRDQQLIAMTKDIYCSLTLESMHVRSASSRAAQPCPVWPEDAQQPLRVLASCPLRTTSGLLNALCALPAIVPHTKYSAHDTQARVLVCLVWPSDAKLGERRKFGRRSGFGESSGGVLSGDHDGE